MGAGVLEGRVVGLVEERLKQAQAPVNLRLWDGQLIRAQQPAPVTLTINSPQALTQLASPSLGRLAKSYVEGEIDLDGNFRDVLRVGEQFVSANHSVYSPRRDRWRWWRHSRSADRRNIQHHYDVGNDFYALWLDRNRVYSCAYFKTPEDSLDAAQEHKLDHICRKLMLKPGRALAGHRLRLGRADPVGGPALRGEGARRHVVGWTARLCARAHPRSGARGASGSAPARLSGRSGAGALRQDFQCRHVRARRAAQSARLLREDRSACSSRAAW